ncbi:MAG: M28 family peptidase [Proteobacteria bacterium]|nr:M28 family peptidase [Pseudomonadota bacterium]
MFLGSSLSHAAPAKDAKYAAIDGKHLWQYVVEQADIARRYRDSGHPQFWGRLAGTSGDVEDAEWLLNKYKQIGLETRLQAVNFFAPQWAAETWSMTAVAGGKSIPIASAEPAYASPGTDGKELDLEVVYVGLGSEADFAGRDVRGKAILLVKVPASYQAGPADILKRAEEHGAAAILSTDLRGGNYSAQSYRAYTKVPTFNLGTKDGEALRDMIGASAGGAAHVKIRLDAKWTPDQKSYLVWGTLPGMTDETIYVIAHRDGFFDAAGDNASGVATMLGLAEHFARIPKSQRRRTIIFLGLDGHHQVKPGGFGREWLVANRDRYFAKTALMINAEHPAEVLTHGGTAGSTTTGVPLEWYGGGASRPQLQKITEDAFREFGVPIWSQPSARPPAGDLGRFYWFVPGVVAQSNDFANMHTAGDSPDVVSGPGLAAVTRAYAKIIDGVNKISLKDLQVPAASDPNAPGTPQGYLSLANCEAWIGDSAKPCVQ